MISPDFPGPSSRPSFSDGRPAPLTRPSLCDSGFESGRAESRRSLGEGGPPVDPAPDLSASPPLRGPTSEPDPQTQDPISQTLLPSAPLPPIQLARWKTHHEVNPSRRTWEGLDRVWLPTHFDCAGHAFLAAQPDALSLLALWTLLVGLTARLPRPLRGLLVTETGRPLDADALAQMTGFHAAVLTRALSVFADPRVGWLVSPVATTIPGALAEIAAYRAADAAWRRETAQIARLRRQHARKLRVEAQRQEAHFAAAYPQPLPAPVDTWPANFADLTPSAFPPLPDLPPLPAKRRRRPPWESPLPPGVPADWRTLLLTAAPPGTNKTVNHYATTPWQDLTPALQQKVLTHASAQVGRIAPNPPLRTPTSPSTREPFPPTLTPPAPTPTKW
jgi:hypothetical protein